MPGVGPAIPRLTFFSLAVRLVRPPLSATRVQATSWGVAWNGRPGATTGSSEPNILYYNLGGATGAGFVAGIPIAAANPTVEQHGCVIGSRRRELQVLNGRRWWQHHSCGHRASRECGTPVAAARLDEIIGRGRKASLLPPPPSPATHVIEPLGEGFYNGARLAILVLRDLGASADALVPVAQGQGSVAGAVRADVPVRALLRPRPSRPFCRQFNQWGDGGREPGKRLLRRPEKSLSPTFPLRLAKKAQTAWATISAPFAPASTWPVRCSHRARRRCYSEFPSIRNCIGRSWPLRRSRSTAFISTLAAPLLPDAMA